MNITPVTVVCTCGARTPHCHCTDAPTVHAHGDSDPLGTYDDEEFNER